MVNKRGLSPVIATLLLISLGLVLAVIIFFWAKSLIGESITKQGSAIENLCGEVSFDAEADMVSLIIQNYGTVPIYGVEIKKQGFGEVNIVKTMGENVNEAITAGQSKSFPVDGSLTSGDEIIVVPILLGESQGSTKAHVCDEKYGVEIEVQ